MPAPKFTTPPRPPRKASTPLAPALTASNAATTAYTAARLAILADADALVLAARDGAELVRKWDAKVHAVLARIAFPPGVVPPPAEEPQSQPETHRPRRARKPPEAAA